MHIMAGKSDVKNTDLFLMCILLLHSMIDFYLCVHLI